MSNAQRRAANKVVELDAVTPPPATEGHNADTLTILLGDIDALHNKAVSLVDDAVKIARRSTQYLIGAGNGNSQALARLTDTLDYLGKRGLVVKLKAWINEVIHFEYTKTPDGKASYRKAKKKDALAIFNTDAWEQGFHAWEPADDGKEKEEWTLEAHIRRAIKRLVKETKISEADARALVVKAAQEVPLITIVVPETKTETTGNVGGLTTTVDEQANNKDAQ